MGKQKRGEKSTTQVSTSTHKNLFAEIPMLESRINKETPDRGYVPPLDQIVPFSALPISNATLLSLKQGGIKDGGKKFTTMTYIQNACIPHALAGRDILGTARTGSGKTLAFLVPLIEKLYRGRISSIDGPAGIVLSPTRELAAQIFQVLRVVGCFHDFSAGLLVGGKKEFELEQIKITKTNIIVATPGRLLQHLEQTPNFDVSGVMMLVLDEADRILDLGFRDQMIRILDYLPSDNRQMLLFSATQTKCVANLAKLSLKKPQYIGFDVKKSLKMPDSLEQSYMVVSLQHKLDVLFSFIKSHLKKKTMIFFSSCSQVRYVYALFCTMQPGIPLLALHGKNKQERRTQVYFEFLSRPHAVLVATDVAARGLDFPNVDWVVQADAPEDKDMYIHRVGRTARHTSRGNSLLLLLPSELSGMTVLFEKANIPITKKSLIAKMLDVSKQASILAASNPNLNALGKKAYKSYLRSVHLMPNKDIFKVSDLPYDDFAASLGLAYTPATRFLNNLQNREELRSAKNINRKLQKLKEQIKSERLENKIKKMQHKGSDNKEKLNNICENDNSENDDLLVVKMKHNWEKDYKNEDQQKYSPLEIYHSTQHKKSRRICIEGNNRDLNKKVRFNEDGSERLSHLFDIKGPLTTENSVDTMIKDYEHQLKKKMSATIDQDKYEEKRRIRQKHHKDRRRPKDQDNNNMEAKCSTRTEFSTCGNVTENNNASRETLPLKEEYISCSNQGDDSDDYSIANRCLMEDEGYALSLIRNRK